MDLPCDLQVVSAWDVPGNSASSSQVEGEGEFLGLWECCDNVEMTRDEVIVHWVRQRFEGRGSVSMSVSPAFFVEDLAAMSSSILGDLSVKFRDDL